MNKVAEFRSQIQRRRPSSGEWEFLDKIGQYEIQATEYLISGNSAWFIKVGDKNYWAHEGTISLAAWNGERLEKFADAVDIDLQGCICEALRRFENTALPVYGGKTNRVASIDEINELPLAAGRARSEGLRRRIRTLRHVQFCQSCRLSCQVDLAQ